MATTFTWDNAAASAWATDHWGRAGVAPAWPGDAGSAVSDKVIIISANKPTGGPAALLTVAEYTCKTSTFNCGANLTVSTALTMGTAAGADNPVFAGTASAGCALLFQGGSFCSGTVGDNATFNNTAQNTGTVGDSATFNDNSQNVANAGDLAIFNDNAVNSGTVVDLATFNDLSSNQLIVGDYATFNDAGSNTLTATLGDFASFNSLAAQYGVFTGTQYYSFSDMTYFDGTAIFTGVAPIAFALETTAAAILGFMSDPLLAPLDVTIYIDPLVVADLITTNLRTGKTVLGVAGSGTLSGFGPFPVGSVAVGPFPIEASSIGPYPIV